MHHRVQRLDPPVEHLGEVGQLARRRAPAARRRAAPARCRRSRPARRRAPRAPRASVDEAGLVGDGDQRAPDRHQIGGHAARRSSAAQGGPSGAPAGASAMRPKDQVIWPEILDHLGADNHLHRRQRRRGAPGRNRPTPRARARRRRRGTSRPRRDGRVSSDDLPRRVELGHDRRVQVEARREARAARRGAARSNCAAGAGVGDGQDVLAAQLLAAGVDEEPPLLQEAVAGDVAVLGGQQPLAGGVLRLPHRDQRRPLGQPRAEGAGGEAAGLDPRRGAAVDLDRRLRRGLPRR